LASAAAAAAAAAVDDDEELGDRPALGVDELHPLGRRRVEQVARDGQNDGAEQRGVAEKADALQLDHELVARLHGVEAERRVVKRRRVRHARLLVHVLGLDVELARVEHFALHGRASCRTVAVRLDLESRTVTHCENWVRRTATTTMLCSPQCSRVFCEQRARNKTNAASAKLKVTRCTRFDGCCFVVACALLACVCVARARR
jgi:hypothetical protein